MKRFMATFTIDSRTDALAVERLTDRLYDAVREELQTAREDAIESTEILHEFEALRDAAREASPGRLTVIYEQQETAFGE